MKSIAVLAFLVIVYMFNEDWGIRFIGLIEILWAIYVLKNRNIGFGVEGHAESAFLSGKIVVIVGLAGLILGVLIFIWPDIVKELSPRY